MKSAYEIAMEKLEREKPQASLSAEQKERIAEIDSQYQAKIAEKRVFLGDLLVKARAHGRAEEAAELEKQLSSEMRRLELDCEEKKQAVRESKS